MNRTTDQINTALDNLTVRLNQVDGIGLTYTSESTIASLTADIAGMRETVNQVVLALDSHLNDLEASVAELQHLLNAHLGL